MKASRTKEQTQDFLVDSLARLIKVKPADIDTSIAFDRYGLDSAGAVELTGLIGEWIGKDLEPTLLYDHPTVDKLTAFVMLEQVRESGSRADAGAV